MLPLVPSAFVLCAGSLRVPCAGSVESFGVSGELWDQWRALGSGPVSEPALCSPQTIVVPALWAVFGSMDDPGIGIRASLMHFLSSLLPPACHEHQISSPGAFQPARSVSVMCSPFPLLFPHSFPALVLMVAQICFKSS